MKISKNLLKKLICIALVVLFSLCMISSSVKAATFSASEFETGAQMDEKVDKLVTGSAVTAISIARIVGVTIAIVMLLVIAIRYMVSSAGDRADIKKHAVAYVVGAIVLFGAVGILGIIDDFTQKALPPQ